MSHATTFDEARSYMDASTRVIITLPRNEYAYRDLSNRQWTTWLQAHRRLSASIQTRAPISVNGITTAAYNRSMAPISVNGVTTAAYNRSRAPVTVNGITTAAYNRSRQLDTRPTTGITPDEYNRLVRGMYY
jgi:hypothetical protein